MAEGIVSYPSLEMILQRAMAAPQDQPQAVQSVGVSDPIPMDQGAPNIPMQAVQAAQAQAPGGEMESAYERAAAAARARMNAIMGRANEAGISDRDKWLSLALGGARMASSRNPYLLGAFGEGAETGIQNLQQADQRAKAVALRRAEQEVGAENAAERAGARAEDRVIRREDIGARAQARLDALEARREELAARAQDRALDREQRAEAQRQLRETQLEIAKLTATNRLDVAGLRAKASGANGTRETRWIEYARERGLVPDSPEGDAQALAMIRPSKDADLNRTRANIASQIYKTMLQDPLDRRTPQEKQAAATAAAEGFMGGGAPAAPAAAPAPAPAPAAPRQGATGVPPRPQGVPGGAQYSPSQQKWWWKDESGSWQSN